MYRKPDALDAAHVLTKVTKELGEFIWHGVSDGIGNVHRRRAGLDRRLDHLRQEFELRTRSILGRELHVLAESSGELHPFDRRAQDLLLRHVELVLAVDGAGREEHVDPPARRIRERAGGELDV